MRPCTRHPFASLALLCLVVLFARPGAADLYEWTDDEGRVHYSNEPRPGSESVGLAPLALEPEGGDDETPADVVRRDRLKRQRADRWVDGQETRPTERLDPVWVGPDGTVGYRPAAPAKDDYAAREQECQRRHGMSCRQHELWKQAGGNDCNRGPATDGCQTAAEIEEKKRKAAESMKDYEPSPRQKRRIRTERNRKKREAANRARDAALYGR